MSKKTIALLFILIITPLIIYLLWPSDESRIKKLFKEGSQAIEKEDLETVMSKVSFNYRDEYGFTYLYLKEIMKTLFKQMDDIKVEYENIEIIPHGEYPERLLGLFPIRIGHVKIRIVSGFRRFLRRRNYEDKLLPDQCA